MSSPPQNNKILKQCESNADILLDNFQSKLSREILKQFKSYGVSIQHLLDLQLVIPVIYPWDKEYDGLRFNTFPMAIVMCEIGKHVEIAVEWAYKRKISIDNDHMIIDQSRRSYISIRNNIAVIDPFVSHNSLQLELSKSNLAFVSEIYPNSGIGLLSRKYGLSSDNLLEAGVILCNGDIIRVNSKENKDLFWALRGTNDFNIGIITELVFKVYSISEVSIFELTFSLEKIGMIINNWQHWAPFADNNLTSQLIIANNKISIKGQYIGNEGDLKKLIPELHPEDYSIKQISFIDAVRKFSVESFYPYFITRHGFAKNIFPQQVINIIQKYVKLCSTGDTIIFHALGGIISKIPVNKTAFPYRDAPFYCYVKSSWRYQEQANSKLNWINNFYNELEPYIETNCNINHKQLQEIEMKYKK
jgi:hypothetical protein